MSSSLDQTGTAAVRSSIDFQSIAARLWPWSRSRYDGLIPSASDTVVVPSRKFNVLLATYVEPRKLFISALPPGYYSFALMKLVALFVDN